MKQLLRPVYLAAAHTASNFSKWLYPLAPWTPTRVTVLFTRRCNLSCDYCSVKESLNQPEPNRLSLDEWKRIFDLIPRTTVIDFSGGEIFLGKDFNPVIQHLLSKRRPVSLISNGTAISEKHIDFFIQKKLTYLMFSLDGMSAHHDKARGKEGAFEHATNILKYLKQKKLENNSHFPIACVKTVIGPDNHQEIVPLLNLSEHTLGVDHMHFAVMYHNRLQMSFLPFEDHDHPDLYRGNTMRFPDASKAKVKEAIREIWKYKKTSKMHLGIAPEMKNPDEVEAFIDDPSAFGVKSCRLPWGELYLLYDGTITSCISKRFGNIRELDYDIKKVFGRPEMSSWLKHFSKHGPWFPACEGCCRPWHSRKPA